MTFIKKLLFAAFFVGLSFQQVTEVQSSCESCKLAVADFLSEWAAVEPTLAADLPGYLCKGCQLAEVCAQLVSQGLSHVSQALNRTSPEEACVAVRWCENSSRSGDVPSKTLVDA
jgi:hypothetical protein